MIKLIHSEIQFPQSAWDLNKFTFFHVIQNQLTLNRHRQPKQCQTLLFSWSFAEGHLPASI